MADSKNTDEAALQTPREHRFVTYRFLQVLSGLMRGAGHAVVQL